MNADGEAISTGTDCPAGTGQQRAKKKKTKLRSLSEG